MSLLARFEAHARTLSRSHDSDIQAAHALAQRWTDRLTADEFGEGPAININAARFDLDWLDRYVADRTERLAA